ncbi:4-hydroxybenzoate polyprenyltransferase [Fluviicoccus keumensis]|uniref:4-hydroxybenzoate polyprenyltransferase n=1 Tax=Fluviicoccus keumensis TaxID=1435465 RepID=A0A4Q7ZC48_9GAMM|nr:prenyltransferase [Fluviicoccus keumensis]RZU48200.1 4-hydroxybenzoate polyprenyltransferase [Fluviicoccus keumensis]
MTDLNINSPWPARFMAWVHQRFALPNALLFFILYITAAVVARAAAGGEIALGGLDVLACVVTWSFFLLLRVFDEHKDYELDCKNHPTRVLQSGLITLDHLKIVGGVTLVLQLGFSLARDGGFGPTMIAWSAMFAWTCLMGKEFFIEEWLNKHLTWYAVSHMLVMPLIVWWLANMAVPGVTLTPQLEALMLLAFISGFCFEITRKTKGPEEERDTIESYSRIFGTQGSAMVVMGLVTAMVVNQIWLINLLSPEKFPIWSGVVLGLFWLMGMKQLLAFTKAPSTEGREKNEKSVALTLLAGYAVVIGVVLSLHGAVLV